MLKREVLFATFFAIWFFGHLYSGVLLNTRQASFLVMGSIIDTRYGSLSSLVFGCKDHVVKLFFYVPDFSAGHFSFS